MSYKILKIFPDVMTDSRLRSLEEKLIVCHVLGFQQEGKCTFSSNATIGGLIDRSEHETYEIIKSLANRGIVRLTYPTNGTARFITIATPSDVIDCAKADQTDIFEY